MADMPQKEPPPPTPANKPRRGLGRLRYSMTTLLVIMVLFSVLGAAIHYGLQAVDAGLRFEAMLAVLLVLAPPLMIFTLKITLAISQWTRNKDSDNR